MAALVGAPAAALAGPAVPVSPAAASPTQAGAPWPTMRHDTRNTGRSAIAARWHGDRPWSFATGRGIFSTPVIGADGAIYVGSADRSFYALEPDGRERWRIRTGGIIDAAAAIGRFDRRLRTAPLTFGSGDERLYHVRTDRRRLSQARRVLWTFRASRRPATTQLVNWWEGNVGLAPDGTIMAGNTGGAAYALTPAGRLCWAFQTGNSVWTTPAFSRSGASYWGSLDFRAFSLDRDGRERWSKPAAGYFVASPALGADGTVRGPANRRPRGVRAGALTMQRPTAGRAGEVSADLRFAPGRGLLRRDRQVSLLLASGGGRPLALDYPRLTRTDVTARGEVRRVRLRLPAGTAVPAGLRVHVIADVFPLATRTLR